MEARMSKLEICNSDEFKLSENERQRCEIFTRVMGYIRPVSEYNIGKRQEHADRVHFEEKSLHIKETTTDICAENNKCA